MVNRNSAPKLVLFSIIYVPEKLGITPCPRGHAVNTSLYARMRLPWRIRPPGSLCNPQFGTSIEMTKFDQNSGRRRGLHPS